MVILKAVGLSVALAWWVTCALFDFWFAKETWKSKRVGTISPKGDALYDAARIVSLFSFTAAGIMSIWLVYQTWEMVMKL